MAYFITHVCGQEDIEGSLPMETVLQDFSAEELERKEMDRSILTTALADKIIPRRQQNNSDEKMGSGEKMTVVRKEQRQEGTAATKM